MCSIKWSYKCVKWNHSSVKTVCASSTFSVFVFERCSQAYLTLRHSPSAKQTCFCKFWIMVFWVTLSVRWLQRFCTNLPSSSGQAFIFTMKMETTNSSVIAVTALQTTWCHISPDRNLHLHYSGGFKFKCIHKVNEFFTIWTAILLGSAFIR
jgi:hypothetical protein